MFTSCALLVLTALSSLTAQPLNLEPPGQYNFLKQQPRPSVYQVSDPFALMANELLLKCSMNGQTVETCDLCSLCRNGAICQQRPRDPMAKGVLVPPPPASPVAATQYAQAFLKTQVNLVCYCVPGYTGTYCQIDINECLSNPCSNNATCMDRINSYECKCPPGFRGDLCEININECDSTPCMHGGTCVDLIDGYYCHCPAGYTGPTCSIDIDDCAGNPCKNNVACIDLVNR